MIYEAVTNDGLKLELKNPLKVNINMDENAPAHALNGEFVINFDNVNVGKISELHEITVYDDSKNKVIFDGIIDEQINDINDRGVTLKLLARSTAALLLDNEALPQTYCRPSVKTIFERHAKPYGFLQYIGENTMFSSKFLVKKGTSEWEVLSNFCAEFLNVVPFITPSRFIDITGKNNDDTICFSNKLEGQVYTSITENIKRHEPISEVHIRCSKNGSYSTIVKNNDAINKGIIRKRYIDAVDTKKPVNLGQDLINKSQINSYEIIVCSPCSIIAELGTKAIVDDKIIGYIPGMKIKSIDYTLNEKLELCKFTLVKELI